MKWRHLQRGRGGRVRLLDMEAKPKWHVHMCNGRTRPPPLSAIGPAMPPDQLLIAEIACSIN